ncbi:MAG: N-6 DNA methylase, partial [Deltaproteobacteria bacterium]|nr:N-6 DNA methylase [Deltaproteobacteria bacterium]
MTGIHNVNEYFSNHYLFSIFESHLNEKVSLWREKARSLAENSPISLEDNRALLGPGLPWNDLKEFGRSFNLIHENFIRARNKAQSLELVRRLADRLLVALDYPAPAPFSLEIEKQPSPIYSQIKDSKGQPWLWVLLTVNQDDHEAFPRGHCFDGRALDQAGCFPSPTSFNLEELIQRIFFRLDSPPRWLLFIGIDQIALIDRQTWNDQRYLYFDLTEIFGRREDSTIQAMAVLLHRQSICPQDNLNFLDELNDNSRQHTAGVSEDLKFALSESIELLGNEILFFLASQPEKEPTTPGPGQGQSPAQGENSSLASLDSDQLTKECLRFMYRLIFVLFIESKSELGYAPMKNQIYLKGYSLDYLREMAEKVRLELETVDEYYLHESIDKLFGLIYNGYYEEIAKTNDLSDQIVHQNIFGIESLKAHIFDPEFTPIINKVMIRDSVMLKIIDLLSMSRETGPKRKKGPRGRVCYSTLGINQLGSVYEALLSYSGFIAKEKLYEVKQAKEDYNRLKVGYFVPEAEFCKYSEDEKVIYIDSHNKRQYRKYEKGDFIYRLAGREREKSASYYTPESLVKSLVKHSLIELLKGKSSKEILEIKICEPAMGSAAFLNEAVNQLAEAYLERFQKENGQIDSNELKTKTQRLKMFITDRNVYGVDLNNIAVELAEVSLFLNSIHKGCLVPWFGRQLLCGNSLIGARRQVYHLDQLSSPKPWWENPPQRLEPGQDRQPDQEIYHFLIGDPGMSDYQDRVIRKLEPMRLPKIQKWNKEFTAPYSDNDLESLLILSKTIDQLWLKQTAMLTKVDQMTKEAFCLDGHQEDLSLQRSTVKQKDAFFAELYQSLGGPQTSPYARLKMAMDYWCALWFWPIEKAPLLPTRDEFLVDLSLILQGWIEAVDIEPDITSPLARRKAPVSGSSRSREKILNEIKQLYANLGQGPEAPKSLNLEQIRAKYQRLEIASQIAQKQRFFHWELEFSQVFAQRGGFDLVLGNPPWIRLEWQEKNVLSESQPIFAVKELSASQTDKARAEALESDASARKLYFSEYQSLGGAQAFFKAVQNYPDLKKQKVNLYKCFIPQAWMIGTKTGISAFIHQNSIFNEVFGDQFRQKLYK